MKVTLKLLITCIFLVALGSDVFPQEWSKEGEAKFLQISRKAELEYGNKVFLHNWVYKKSSRISRMMVEQIVECTLREKEPLFLLALMQVESSFDPTSVSKKGALGLGQIMPNYHVKELKRVGIIKETRDLFDISTGVKAMEYIWGVQLLRVKGNIVEALVRYYGSRNKWYIEQVMRNFRCLKSNTEGL